MVEVTSSRDISGLVWYLGQVYKALVLETELEGDLRGLEAIRPNFAYRAGRDTYSASNSSRSNMFWTVQIWYHLFVCKIFPITRYELKKVIIETE